YCAGRGIRLVSDEIYHGITYEVPAETARACGRDAIVVNSFSKYYSMTGWRLGWMLVPPDLAHTVECLAQNFYISPPALSQLAAAAALDCRAELDGHVARLGDSGEVCRRLLAEAGIAATPGLDFDPIHGRDWLRLSFAGSSEDIDEAARRLKHWLPRQG